MGSDEPHELKRHRGRSNGTDDQHGGSRDESQYKSKHFDC